jgi:hypothetical protein
MWFAANYQNINVVSTPSLQSIIRWYFIIQYSLFFCSIFPSGSGHFPYFACMRALLLSFFLFVSLWSAAQFSLSTDVSLLRNHSPRQGFGAPGQTIRGGWYTSPKSGPYASLTYYLRGKFNNNLTAQVKDTSFGLPLQQDFEVRSSWQFRQLSLGWKHYFKGTYNLERSWSLYGLAGFGLLFTSVDNRYASPIDTAAYHIANPQQGAGRFRRLTFDLGIGGEWEIGADIYAYTELRTWIQASDTPSPWMVQNHNVPLTTSVHAGLRLLIW